MEIKIYTSPNCPHSDNAKKFFKKKKIRFEEISFVKNEPARLEVIEATGQMATPVIRIDKEVVVGFDESALKTILKEKQPRKR